MRTLVFCDRDGTITRDENYYLGSRSDWRTQVSFLDGVVDGIKLLNTIPDSFTIIVTNQSGVALQGSQFDELTLERAHEVNQYVVGLLSELGARIDGYYMCPFVDNAYVEIARGKGRTVNPAFVHDNHPDLKPNCGMILRAIAERGFARADCKVYVIGDRFSDIKMALHAQAIGILVESDKTRELGNVAKVAHAENGTYIATDFLAAARLVYEERDMM